MNPNKILTELPEAIRHQILSLLTTADAMATAQLSKTWQHDWLSLPCLDFDKQFFKQTHESVPIHEKQRNQTLLFCNFIQRILERRASLHNKQGPASSLHLLERLSLFVPPLSDQSKSHNLQEFAFTNFKIKKLEFNHDFFTPYDGFNLPCHVNVHSLKSLGLRGVAVHQSTMDMLAHNCPFLEQLKFGLCHVFGTVIEFRGLSKLVRLNLGLTLFLEGQLVINLPSLLLFHYSATRSNRFDMNVVNAENLRLFDLHNVRVKDGLLDEFLPRLPRLERLELRPSQYMEKLRISNHSLKRLTVELNLGNLVELYIDAPRLEKFIYYHKSERVRGQPVPPIFIRKNFAPKKSIVQLKLNDLKDSMFTEFLQIINEQSKHLELHMEGRELYEMKDDDINSYGIIRGIKYVVLFDWSWFTWPTRESMVHCIGLAARLFPDAVTVVHRRSSLT